MYDVVCIVGWFQSEKILFGIIVIFEFFLKVDCCVEVWMYINSYPLLPVVMIDVGTNHSCFSIHCYFILSQ